MFPDLSNFLNLSSDSPPNGLSVSIVEDGSADASFILHHFITSFLKMGHNVCLVGLVQSFNHYRCIANKLAVNLTKQSESGQFVMIEGLKLIGSDICHPLDSGKTLCPNIGTSDSASRECLKNLFLVVRASLLSLSEWNIKKTVLLIDDLSVFLALGFSAKDIVMFVQQLHSFICPSADSLGTLVCLIHSSSGEDKELSLISKKIGYQSDLVLYVSALRSGYCREVDGELVAEFRAAHKATGQIEIRMMHFKVTDKTVKLFPAGTSTAVL